MNWYINLLRKLAFWILDKLYNALWDYADKNKDGKIDQKEINQSLLEIKSFMAKYKTDV